MPDQPHPEHGLLRSRLNVFSALVLGFCLQKGQEAAKEYRTEGNSLLKRSNSARQETDEIAPPNNRLRGS